jgi:hypothetical protein
MPEFDEINEIGCWEWHLHSFDGSRLCLVGGTDLDYYHVAELWISGLTYLSCPTRLLHPHFRGPTSTESITLVGIVDMTFSNRIMVIEAETTANPEAQVFFVVGEEIQLVRGTVYYYNRPNLKPGERLAPWVKKSTS